MTTEREQHHQPEDRAPVYVHKGDLLSTNAEAMGRDFGTWVDELEPGTHAQLDLRGASMVDSVGLNLLLSVFRAAAERRIQFTVRLASPSVNRVFEFARLDKLVTIDYREKRRRR